MEQLPGYVLIQPVWQGVTLLLGIYLSAVGLQNLENPDFSVRAHKRIARLFLILVVAGAVISKVIAASLPVGALRSPGETFLAVAVVALVIVGAVFGFQGERMRFRVRTDMMRAHPWLNIAATALVFAQELMSLRALHILKF